MKAGVTVTLNINGRYSLTIVWISVSTTELDLGASRWPAFPKEYMVMTV